MFDESIIHVCALVILVFHVLHSDKNTLTKKDRDKQKNTAKFTKRGSFALAWIFYALSFKTRLLHYLVVVKKLLNLSTDLLELHHTWVLILCSDTLAHIELSRCDKPLSKAVVLVRPVKYATQTLNQTYNSDTNQNNNSC